MIEKTEENIKYYEKLFNENLMLYGCGYYRLCCTHDCPCNLSVSMEEMTYDFDRYNEVRKSLEEEREEMLEEYNNYEYKYEYEDDDYEYEDDDYEYEDDDYEYEEF